MKRKSISTGVDPHPHSRAGPINLPKVFSAAKEILKKVLIDNKAHAEAGFQQFCGTVNQVAADEALPAALREVRGFESVGIPVIYSEMHVARNKGKTPAGMLGWVLGSLNFATTAQGTAAMHVKAAKRMRLDGSFRLLAKSLEDLEATL